MDAASLVDRPSTKLGSGHGAGIGGEQLARVLREFVRLGKMFLGAV